MAIEDVLLALPQALRNAKKAVGRTVTSDNISAYDPVAIKKFCETVFSPTAEKMRFIDSAGNIANSQLISKAEALMLLDNARKIIEAKV